MAAMAINNSNRLMGGGDRKDAGVENRRPSRKGPCSGFAANLAGLVASNEYSSALTRLRAYLNRRLQLTTTQVRTSQDLSVGLEMFRVFLVLLVVNSFPANNHRCQKAFITFFLFLSRNYVFKVFFYFLNV